MITYATYKLVDEAFQLLDKAKKDKSLTPLEAEPISQLSLYTAVWLRRHRNAVNGKEVKRG